MVEAFDLSYGKGVSGFCRCHPGADADGVASPSSRAAAGACVELRQTVAVATAEATRQHVGEQQPPRADRA